MKNYLKTEHCKYAKIPTSTLRDLYDLMNEDRSNGLNLYGIYKAMVLTGRDGFEVQISRIPIPIIVNGHSDDYIVSDLRMYSKDGTVRKHYMVDYEKRKLKIMSHMLTKYDLINKFRKEIIIAHGRWIGGILMQVYLLNADEYNKILVSVGRWTAALMNEDNANGVVDKIYRVSENGYGDLLDINLEVGINGLSNLIKDTLGEDRIRGLSDDGLISILGKTFISTTKDIDIYMGLYHLPTYLSMLYVSGENSLYRRTVLADLAKDQRELMRYIRTITEI